MTVCPFSTCAGPFKNEPMQGPKRFRAILEGLDLGQLGMKEWILIGFRA